MVINIETKNEIIWPVVILYLLQCYVVAPEVFFALCCVCVGVYIIKERSILIPDIPGLVIYLAAIVLITGIGLVKFDKYLIVRDLFYEFSNIIPIILGYYLYRVYGKTKSLWKTVCFMAALSSIGCMITALANLGSGLGFIDLKYAFGNQVIPLGTILPILLGRRFFFREITFSKKKDNILILIMAMQLLFSVSRTAIVSTVVGLCVMAVMASLNKRVSAKLMRRMITMIVCMIVIVISVWNIMPEPVTTKLSDKFSNTFTEISPSDEYRDRGEAESDWRGYEIYCAKQQRKNHNLLENIFGEGNGAVILIKYVPVRFKKFVVPQGGGVGISLLHNTYYTLLIKGGFLTLILFIYFFLANIKKGIKNVKKGDREVIFIGAALVTICVSILVNAYVVRNMFENTILFGCTLLFGWLNAEINNKICKKETQEKETLMRSSL